MLFHSWFWTSVGHVDHQHYFDFSPYWSLCLQHFLDLGSIHVPLVNDFSFRWAKVVSVAYNQSNVSDSALKMKARFWFFSELAFPKVKLGSMSLQFREPQRAASYLQNDISPGAYQARQSLRLNLLPPHFLTAKEYILQSPKLLKAWPSSLGSL